MEEGQPQGGQDRRGAEVALDAIEDGDEPDELARGVERQQLVDERFGAVDRREPATQAGPDLLDADVGGDPREVVVIERAGALLRAAALVATDRAAVVPGDRLGRRGIGGRGVHAFVEPQTISSTTSIRPHVAQRVAYWSPSDTFRLDSPRG